jgi:hypothetical protein
VRGDEDPEAESNRLAAEILSENPPGNPRWIIGMTVGVVVRRFVRERLGVSGGDVTPGKL